MAELVKRASEELGPSTVERRTTYRQRRWLLGAGSNPAPASMFKNKEYHTKDLPHKNYLKYIKKLRQEIHVATNRRYT